MIHRQDSSDELEFAASDLDKSQSSLLKDDDVLFDETLLLEEREDWDLFSEISACYLSKTKMDILNCVDSACCLSPARDRCSSEPSVCHSSRLTVQNHEPVARQSSCDATIIHSHLNYINQMKQLQLESQNLLNEDLAPGRRNTQCGFWRSNQAKTNAKEKSSQMINSSKRSSFSSLSSATTSPSASSLSSLDSAFSYCSESPVFNPSDVTSLPFMFGTSARLHTISPEITRKKLREWHIPLSTLFGASSCDLDSWEMQWDSKEQNNITATDKGNNVVPVQGSSPKGCLAKESSQSSISSGKDGITYLQKPKIKVSHGKTESGNGSSVHKEVTMKQIEIKKAEPSKDEKPQEAKVAFYASPNIMSITNLHDQNPSEDQNLNPGCQVTKLKIPQTVFYGQNTPLVLHSVSRKQNPEAEKPQWQTQLTHVVRRSSTNEIVTKNGDLSSVFTDKEVRSKEVPEVPRSTKETPKSQTKSITTFSQTIRIILPSSVKNTVREYFKHGDPKSPASHNVTVTNDVVQEKTENLQGTEDHPRT